MPNFRETYRQSDETTAKRYILYCFFDCEPADREGYGDADPSYYNTSTEAEEAARRLLSAGRFRLCVLYQATAGNVEFVREFE